MRTVLLQECCGWTAFLARSRIFPSVTFPSSCVKAIWLSLTTQRFFQRRLYGRRSGVKAQPLSPANAASRDFLQGRVEVLLTKQLSQEPNDWECLVRPGRKIGVGEQLFFGEHQELVAEVRQRGEFGERRIRFAPGDKLF